MTFLTASRLQPCVTWTLAPTSAARSPRPASASTRCGRRSGSSRWVSVQNRYNAGDRSSESMVDLCRRGPARRASPGRGYQAKAFLDVGRVQLAGGDGHGEVECLVVGQVQAVDVNVQENHGREQRESFISVDQSVVAGE